MNLVGHLIQSLKTVSQKIWSDQKFTKFTTGWYVRKHFFKIGFKGQHIAKQE